MNQANTALLSLAICSSFIAYRTLIKKHQPAPFPPGPKGHPFLANLTDMPQSQPWKTYTEWAERYGPIVHINVLGNHLVILNDPKYATEMLDSKSRLYSGRPSLVMGGQMVGWDESPGLCPFNDTWTEYRKLMANFLGTRSKVEKFEHVIHEEVKELLTRFMSTPNEYHDHFESYTGSVVLMLIYGYKPMVVNDSLVKIVSDAMQGFSEMTVNGAFAVDSFPMLRFVPSWFPGAGWKKKAMKYREGLIEMLERPYEWTKQQMTLGTARPCFVTNVLEGKQLTPREERVVQWTAAGMYSGGAHTTAAGLCCFLLAAVRHTAELQRAQAEIDAFIGNDRLPTLADRPHLPYFEALCMEVHRLYAIIAPLGAHLADAMQWLASAALIAAFDIRPVIKDGKPVIPPANFQDGTIR
ncbi:hypothetical protein Clacol_009529 [Clathrus columnatus]|uniref:Cytochrome P450 n=1 Tax=Clathrus columnatus TaxID=1419009 RepID=A0AAV5ARD9_9AGAM|nr:hypothetical protein Clacol_009529 [Clathrus columnatus]